MPNLVESTMNDGTAVKVQATIDTAVSSNPILEQVIEAYLLDKKVTLSPGLRFELSLLASGLTSCKDSSARQKVSNETVRAKRKRLYKALNEETAMTVLSSLLRVALYKKAGKAL